jgi:hypothetical protein
MRNLHPACGGANLDPGFVRPVEPRLPQRPGTAALRPRPGDEQILHSVIGENKRHLLGPALIARSRIALPGQRQLAFRNISAAHGCRTGLV